MNDVIRMFHWSYVQIIGRKLRNQKDGKEKGKFITVDLSDENPEVYRLFKSRS